MINFYDVIAASEGIAVADEFATLWGRKISGGYVISTYTGTLPAVLRTMAGFLESYKIWGNTGGVGFRTEQHGYKLPILSNDTATDIYIGDAQLAKDEYVDSETGKIYKWGDITGLSEPLCGIGEYTDTLELSTGTLTRRIMKLVLTGEESISKRAEFVNATAYFYTHYTDEALPYNIAPIICSHFLFLASYGDQSDHIYQDAKNFYITSTQYRTVADFKAYLAAQYTAGTPVTIWYVLAEPEISTVPVPSGLTGTIEGYLIQDETPTPEAPIYPTANGTKQEDGTYSVESAYLTPTDPPAPLPQIPTFAGETTISYGGAGAQPEKVELKYRK